jgi:predicted nucleic acid-binding protein
LEKVALLRKTYSAALSFPDCSCLFLAKELSAILLTGDKPLRKSARENKIRVHGTLWVMDQLINEKIIDHRKAHEKLTLLMRVNNRLPRGECEKRLLAWKKTQ